MKQYKATCKVCKKTNESDNLNNAVLDLTHHLECDERKGISVEYDIEDKKFL